MLEIEDSPNFYNSYNNQRRRIGKKKPAMVPAESEDGIEETMTGVLSFSCYPMRMTSLSGWVDSTIAFS